MLRYKGKAVAFLTFMPPSEESIRIIFDAVCVKPDFFLTSSSCHQKILVKEFSYFLMPCHQHGLGVNLLVQR